jgi:SAM-dependent methyltransferase
MHPRFVPLLRCPQTGSELRLRVDEAHEDGTVKTGRLVRAGGEHAYPIVGGVPRFVDQEHYAGSFGYEWKKWSRVQFERENAGGPMAGHTRRMFEAIAELPPRELRGKLVVEFGCGPGRFIDIARGAGATVVGLDMSAAVEPARANFAGDADVLIVQADILAPPLRADAFDVGYTFGVLHHTPRPADGLRALARVVKPGGVVACSVYPKGGFYDYPSVAAFRRAHQALRSRLGAPAARRLALGYAYLAAYALHFPLALMGRVPLARRLAGQIEKYALVCLHLPDARWRVLDIFDAITPAFASTHTAGEVRGWFDAAGCSGARQTRWGATSFVGVKQSPAQYVKAT